MKVTVVQCRCGNSKPHVKFENPNGEQTGGIFCLARGRQILQKLVATEQMSAAEMAETNAELAATGLPEFTEFSNDELETMTRAIGSASRTPEKREAAIAMNVSEKLISPETADRIRVMIGDLADNPMSDIPKDATLAFLVML
jgi:hypothetical protein